MSGDEQDSQAVSWYQRCLKAGRMRCDNPDSRCYVEHICHEGDYPLVLTGVRLLRELPPEGLNSLVNDLKGTVPGEKFPDRERRHHQIGVLSFLRDNWSS